jgi:uncharacterized repeat protein (TIGR03803 family)
MPSLLPKKCGVKNLRLDGPDSGPSLQEFSMRPQFRSKFLNARPIMAVAAAAVLLAVVPLSSASAYTHQTLHSFCSQANCVDGNFPVGGLLMDPSGNLYGTTEDGGKYGDGLAFKLVPNPVTGKYKEYGLHSFCAKANCPDGSQPLGGLIMDVDGNLYGTTQFGGKYGYGEIYKLTRKATTWSIKVIGSFCADQNTCSKGSIPTTTLAYSGQASGAPWDKSSPLFGTTVYGGAHGFGVAYELTANGYKVIHSFNASAGDYSAYPSQLLVDSSGNLFGVTEFGGSNDGGALYKLAAGTWTETTLHNFCAGPNCTDGIGGTGRLAMDAAGDLFGETLFGGSSPGCAGGGSNQGCGTVFEHTAGGVYSIVYSFCPVSGCADGLNPSGGLIVDSAGNLYGTTAYGGANPGAGVAFELAPGGAESVLYEFCPQGLSCKDGASPGVSLLLDGQGDLFGTTHYGGAKKKGTVFVLKP